VAGWNDARNISQHVRIDPDVLLKAIFAGVDVADQKALVGAFFNSLRKSVR